MITALWSSLGGKVGERWASLLLSPALVFWGGGLLAWVWRHGGFFGADSGWQELERGWASTFGGLTAAGQVVLAVLALLVVAASARLAETLTLGVLRILEGYWPKWASPLRTWLVALRASAINRRARRWRELAQRRLDLTSAEHAEYVALNARRAMVPPAPANRMPTRLGDVLSAAESRPRHRYGLEAVVCWPHLWLAMPEEARVEVSTARARLDEAARVWLWSVLFVVWVVFTWWAVVPAVLGTLVGYRLAISAAVGYGGLVLTCFDLYRKDLYEALGWEFPAGPQQQYETGRRLTAYLERGPALEHQPAGLR